MIVREKLTDDNFMRVFIPYQPDGVGGPYTFARSFRAAAGKAGHEVVWRWQREYDVLFIIAHCSLLYVLDAVVRGKRIVARFDGVYHPGLSSSDGRWYWAKNWPMRVIHRLSDHVVYQSQFSQASCERMLGRRVGPTSTIYNGVVVAAPRQPRPASTPLQLVTSSAWHRRDQVEPLLRGVVLLNEPVDVHVFGRVTPAAKKYFSRTWPHVSLHVYGQQPQAVWLAQLAAADIFIFADQSACPNAMLEALGAGVPVVAYDRGSASELIVSGQSGEIVPLSPHDPWRDSYPFTEESYQQFAAAIRAVANRLPEYQQAALVRASRYDQAMVMGRYLDLLEAVI